MYPGGKKFASNIWNSLFKFNLFTLQIIVEQYLLINDEELKYIQQSKHLFHIFNQD